VAGACGDCGESGAAQLFQPRTNRHGRAGLRIGVLAVKRTAEILPVEGRERRRAERSEKFDIAQNQESGGREVKKQRSSDVKTTPEHSPQEFDSSSAKTAAD